MFFKQNEEKKTLKNEMRELRNKIRERRKLHSKWIRSFMAESDADMAAIQMLVIKKQATDISNMEFRLQLMKKQYKEM